MDLDGNLIERGRSQSEGSYVVVYGKEHVLARRSLWVLHRLDSSLAVGEDNKLCGPVGLELVDERGYRHFNAVELGNVHCGFLTGSKISPLKDALTRGNG
jgi:hypothetical protein